MAKKKMNMNPHDDDFGQDVEDDQPKTVPTKSIKTDRLVTRVEKICTLKSEQRDILTDIATEYTGFDGDGGNKAALKETIKIGEMETQKALDYVRCVASYIVQLGIDKKHGFHDVQLFNLADAPASMPRKTPKAPAMPEHAHA